MRQWLKNWYFEWFFGVCLLDLALLLWIALKH